MAQIRSGRRRGRAPASYSVSGGGAMAGGPCSSSEFVDWALRCTKNNSRSMGRQRETRGSHLGAFGVGGKLGTARRRGLPDRDVPTRSASNWAREKTREIEGNDSVASQTLIKSRQGFEHAQTTAKRELLGHSWVEPDGEIQIAAKRGFCQGSGQEIANLEAGKVLKLFKQVGSRVT